MFTDKVAGRTLEVRGEVEKDALLRINGQEVQPDRNGHFRHPLALDIGKNLIRAEAADKAGNVRTIERTVTLRQETRFIRLDNPEEIISNTEEVAVSGQLLPGATLRIDSKPVQAAERFTLMLHFSEGEHTVKLEAVGPDGESETLHLRVVVDQQPPEIQVSEYARTRADKQLILQGTVSEDAALTLNGKAVRLSERRFEETVVLTEGDNELLLRAEDRAGNQSVWKKKVLRDTQPPEILRHKVSPAQSKGGEVLRLTARIRDVGVGTARSGSFTLEIAGTPLQGILQCTEEKGSDFSGSVFVQPGISGTVQVREIRIQDMLGNRAEYSPANSATPAEDRRE